MLNTTPKQRVVGHAKLRRLLQPEHPYFAGKWGYLTGYERYTHDSDPDAPDLLYPKIRAMHRDNPYRRLLLNKRCGNKSVNRFQQFVDSVDFNEVRMNKLVFPLQGKISAYLAKRDSARNKRKAGVNMAWGMWHRYLAALYEQLPELAGSAWRCNLHTWSTQEPTHPHYHIHALLADLRLVDDKLVKRDFHRYESGLEHPFSPDQLLVIKTLWLKVQVDFAKRHKIKGAFDIKLADYGYSGKYEGQTVREVAFECGYQGLFNLMREVAGTGFGVVNVFVDKQTMHLKPGEGDCDTKDFMFAIKYNGRHWSENYAEYTFEHAKAPGPPVWLQRYENKARLFGWWAELDRWISEDKEPTTAEKVSPFNGRTLTYLYRQGIETVCEAAKAGEVGSLEVEHGRVVLRQLNGADIAWLESVTWPYDQGKQNEIHFEAARLNNELELNELYEELKPQGAVL